MLIPKCKKPMNMKDLRLISLCTVLYIVVVEILANHLKLILPKLILESQATFVPVALSLAMLLLPLSSFII